METIKEEKKAELEQLLNSLIEKGWKPFGITCTDFIKGTGLECIPSYCFNPHPHMCFPGGTRKYHRPSLRQIVSKESGLRQFCAKNRLIDPDHNYVRKWTQQCRYVYDDWDEWDENHLYTDDYDYQYRIIQSALKDESELEDFLLNSIKLD